LGDALANEQGFIDMKTSTKILGLASLVALTMAVACGSDSDTGTPGGASGAGAGGSGTSGSSGSSGTAGATAGSAGKSGSAGTSGTAGTAGSSAGNGGTSGTAGSSGSAGKAGSGGTSGGTSGTGGQAGEAGATSTSETNPYTKDGGYYIAGDMKGYAYASIDALGTTVTPPDFTMLKAGEALCVSGTVVADAGYGGYLTIGVNANTNTAGVAGPALVPTGTGIMVTVDNKLGTFLRVTITGGDTKGYCTTLTGSGGVIPWASFHDQCYANPMGAAFDPAIGMTDVAVNVPGNNTMATPFDVCVNDLSIAP
jgi:hypothetical protein